QPLVTGSRDPAGLPHELRAPLVHRQRARQHARAGIRNAEQLQSTLYGPVLAVAPVQSDEDAVEALRDELLGPALGRIERMRIHAVRGQGGTHHGPAVERAGARGRFPAERDRHFPELGGLHAGSPMILTSGTRSMPWRRFTVSRACAISASM